MERASMKQHRETASEMDNEGVSTHWRYPVIRVYTCGEFALERLIPSSASPVDPPQYEPVPRGEWSHRGPAITMLKVLLCSDDRRASRDTLIEEIWPGKKGSAINADHALHSAASVLRTILRAPGEKSLLLNTTGSDGIGYKLADQQQLWTDMDAFESYISDAGKAARLGHDALPLWEVAYQLAQRPFLPDDLYSSWSQERREILKGNRRLCIYRLAVLYSERDRKDEAEVLLRSLWAANPTNEDALRRLMLLLEEQARYQEALLLYERTERALDEERRLPAKQTKELAERICTRPLSLATEVRVSLQEQTQALNDSSQQLFPLLLVPSTRIPEKVSQQPIPLPATFAVENILSPGSLLARVMMLMDQRQDHTTSCERLQSTIDQEIERFDSMKQQHPRDESILSRRDALVMIAGLPLSLLLKVQQEPMIAPFADDFLTQCAASITACWHLMRGSQLSVVEEVLSSYLPMLTHLAQQPSWYQKTAASFATQGYRLNGILALHRNNFRVRDVCFQQAVQYSEIAENPSLQVSALISLAYHNQDPWKATQIYQRGLIHKNEISSLLLSRLYVELAVVYAQQAQEQEALRYMSLAQEVYPEHPEADPSFLYAEFSLSSMVLEKGLTLLALGQHYPHGRYRQQAWETFTQIETPRPVFLVPERTRLEIINYQAKTALTFSDLDKFCDYLEKGAMGAKALGSEKRRGEAIEVYKEARSVWPNEPRVKELADLFF